MESMEAQSSWNGRYASSICSSEEPQCSTGKWYFSQQEIEDHSPSRKDGIDREREVHLRKSYCSLIKEIGMKLKMPQVTIACAMLLCHRFYMRQSHAKNDWQTVATASTFLASKIEDTPRFLKDIIVVAYEMLYQWDPSAPKRIRQREVYDKQKQLIVRGERLFLETMAFDLDIQLPYKPLVDALKRLGIFHILAKVAWNFVNDWLCTTLCLQYKPHYVAAGSLFLAAKFQKVKLPMEKGRVWWHEFDISPKQLEEVIQHMIKLLEQDRKQAVASTHERGTRATISTRKANISTLQSFSSSRSHEKSCSSSGVENSEHNKSLGSGDRQDITKEVLPCHTSDSGASSVLEDGDAEIHLKTKEPNQKSCSKIVSSQGCADSQVVVKEVLPSQTSDGITSSVVEDSNGDGELKAGDSDQDPSFKIVSVCNNFSTDAVNRIRDALKRKKHHQSAKRKCMEATDAEIDSEAWIERELESGIDLESASYNKMQRRALRL